MRVRWGMMVLGFTFVAVLFGSTGAALAGDGTDARLRALEDKIRQQETELTRLRATMTEQQASSESLEAELESFLSKAEDSNWWAEKDTMRAFYKQGLHFETADKVFNIHIGGRIFADWAWFDDDEEDLNFSQENLYEEESHGWDDQIGITAARLHVAGELYKNTTFKAEFDFAHGDATFKNVWLGLRRVPVVQNLRIGNQKMPFSLEGLTSSRFITFMGRAMPVAAFGPGYQHGIQIFDAPCDGQWTWAFGMSGDSNSYGNGTTDKSLYTRWTGAPLYEPDADYYTIGQLGTSLAYRRMNDDEWSFGSGAESALGPDVVNTGTFDADNGFFWGFEGLLIYGPFSMQAEYIMVDMDVDSGSDLDFNGWYIYASFFLTEGDRRHWKNGVGTRVFPKTLFHDDPGTGAVELGLRYSDLDLDDEDVNGGEADAWTIGLNWYLNSQTRVMLNYTWADVDHDRSRLRSNGLDEYVEDVDVFQIRFQIDF